MSYILCYNAGTQSGACTFILIIPAQVAEQVCAVLYIKSRKRIAE